TCGGGNPPKANACGCAAESDAAFCARNGKNCGSYTGTDNCGAARTANCGSTCGGSGATCGGGGNPNVCGCVDPAACAGKNCGTGTPNEFGGTVNTAACTGKNCGTVTSNCGGSLSLRDGLPT